METVWEDYVNFGDISTSNYSNVEEIVRDVVVYTNHEDFDDNDGAVSKTSP